jgi:hypothetical protein
MVSRRTDIRSSPLLISVLYRLIYLARNVPDTVRVLGIVAPRDSCEVYANRESSPSYRHLHVILSRQLHAPDSQFCLQTVHTCLRTSRTDVVVFCRIRV